MRSLLVLALCLAACPAFVLSQNVTFIQSTGFGLTLEEAYQSMGVWQHTYVWPTAYFSLDYFNAALLAQNATGSINSTAAMLQGLAILPAYYTPPAGLPDWYIVIAGIIPFAGHMSGFFVLATSPDNILLVKEFVGVAYKQDGMVQFQATSKDNSVVVRAALAQADDGTEVYHATLSQLSADYPTSPTNYANQTALTSLGYVKMEDWTVNQALTDILKVWTPSP